MDVPRLPLRMIFTASSGMFGIVALVLLASPKGPKRPEPPEVGGSALRSSAPVSPNSCRTAPAIHPPPRDSLCWGTAARHCPSPARHLLVTKRKNPPPSSSGTVSSSSITPPSALCRTGLLFRLSAGLRPNNRASGDNHGGAGAGPGARSNRLARL